MPCCVFYVLTRDAPLAIIAFMYIRKTKTSSSAKGTHFSYRLVQSQRVAGKVKQTTLLNLGAHFDLPAEHWPELCLCIEQQLTPQNSLLTPDYPPAVLEWVQRLVTRLNLHANDDNDEPQWIERVDLRRGQDEDVRSVALERLGLHSLEQLGLPALLTRLGLNDSYQKLAIALIIARMIRPQSELATYHWLSEVSALPELLGIRAAQLKLERLYRVGDALYAHKASLEQHLSKRCGKLFGSATTIVLYDLTNTWFTTTKPGSELCQYGRGKQRGTKAPVVTLGLSLDSAGFPLHSEILAGNVSEPGTLEQALTQLPENQIDDRSLVVMDAGICTEENCQWLVAQGYDYVTISRTKQAIPDRESDTQVITRAKDRVRLWRVDETSEAVYLVVHSPSREAQEKAMLEKKRTLWEIELTHLQSGLLLPRRIKKTSAVHEKLGRLKQKYASVQSHYDIKVISEGKNVTQLDWSFNHKKANADQKVGSYVLRSSRTDMSEEALIQLYWQLNEIESTFRSLKSELGMRPIYHQKDERIGAHIWQSVLAFYAVHSLRCQLKSKGNTDSWSTIRKQIGHRVRLSTRYPNDQDEWVGYRRDTPPTVDERLLLDQLDIPVVLHRKKIRNYKA